jgi:hypothetical protein
LAFRQSGTAGKAASEEWRWRIEEDLKVLLDYQVKEDWTVTLWCGLSRHDFAHEPTSKELLKGLDDVYRRELARRGLEYPQPPAHGPEPSPGPVPAAGDPDSISVETHSGPVEISWASREALLDEIRLRESGEDVVRSFEAVGASRPVSLDREGKIILFDALWAMANAAGGYQLIDPQLRLLQDKLKDEIVRGSGTQSY